MVRLPACRLTLTLTLALTLTLSLTLTLTLTRYDFLHDVIPHRDRHNRQWDGEWTVKMGP